MVSFRSKKISTYKENLSERLRKARNERKLSLEDISDNIKVGAFYLDALERGDYQKLPGELYAKNFIKKYTGLLNLNFDYHYSLYLSEQKIIAKIQPMEYHNVSAAKKVNLFNLSIPTVLKAFIVSLAVVGLLTYLGIKINAIIAPPTLQITSPADNIKTTDEYLVIQGTTEAEAIVTINNEEVYGDNGYFEKTVHLSEGLNTIKIVAKKKHSLPKAEARNILLLNATQEKVIVEKKVTIE